jgi:GDP-L-fucose synthase
MVSPLRIITNNMRPQDKIFVAGHNGLVGSAVVRALNARGYHNLVLRSRAECDLRQQTAVEHLFASEKPNYVFFAAAKVGGIVANNTWRYDFLADNLLMATHVIDAAKRHNVKKMLFLGSSCIYPKLCPQPMKEEDLLTGALETTNEPYALAKIAGLKLIENSNRQYETNFISGMPTNLYGPGDNFDLISSHVLPAMMRKFHEAKLNGHAPVTLWGSGTPRREFLYVDDLADACLFLIEHLSAGSVPGDFINIGCGHDLTIAELASIVQNVVGHRGAIEWDATKPDGTPRKLQDVSRLSALGWRAQTTLQEGLQRTYAWFLERNKG